MQLHIECEVIWCCCAPALGHSRFRHRIKCRIYLDQFEMLCVPSEPFPRRHVLRIPPLDKTGIRPTCRADKNFFAHMSTKSQRWRKQTRLIDASSLVICDVGEKNGSRGRIRTYDQSVNSRPLYH